MVRNRPWIVDLLWLAVVLLLVSLHFWFPDVGSGQASDTFSTTAEGKKPSTGSSGDGQFSPSAFLIL